MTHVPTHRGENGQWLFGIVILGLSVLIALSAPAATYYVDATLGNDSNGGLSAERAWQTLDKVTSEWFEPGDFVLLKRGEVFRGRLMFGVSGEAGHPITFSAYGEGEKPVITGADEVTGWTAGGVKQYSAAVASAPEVVVFDGTAGTRASGLEEVDAPLEWYYEGGVLTVYALAAPVNMEASSRQFLLGLPSNEHLVIRDLTFRHGENGVYLYNTNHVVLDGLTVYETAGAGGIFAASDSFGRGEYNTVQNCEVYGTRGSQASQVYGDNGDAIYLWGADCRHNTITGNHVHHNGQEGVVVLGGSYNVISHNVTHHNVQSGIRVGLETSVGNIVEWNSSYENCQGADDRYGIDLIRVGDNNIVRYNVVHDQYKTLDDPSIPADPTNNGHKYGTGGIRFDGGNWEGHDHMNSRGNTAYYNLVYNEDIGIDSFNFDAVELYNNTIYNSTVHAIAIASVFTVDAVDNVVQNNVIHSAGETLIYHYRNVNTVLDNNVYFNADANAFLFMRLGDTYCYVDFGTWQSLSGQDSNSLFTDPLLVDAPGADFRLAADSPCVDFGAALGYVQDLEQVEVPQQGAADAGAYEFVAALSPEPEPEPTPATVLLTSAVPELTNAGVIPVHVEFSEAVTGFDAADLLVGNGTASNFSGGGASYTFDLEPIAQGVVTVDIAANAAQTDAGAGSEAAETFGRTYDSIAPAVTLSADEPSSSKVSSALVYVRFSEAVADFTASDIALENATMSGFSGSGADYVFTLLIAGSGSAIVHVAADVAIDSAGNGNTAAQALSLSYDNESPDVTLYSPTPYYTRTKPILITVTFTEPVTGFNAEDVQIEKGSLRSFSGSGSVYTLSVNPRRWSLLSVTIPAGVAFDASGNPNKASETLGRFYYGR